MNNDVLSVYIGNDDIVDWTLMTGKDIIMPELLKSAETLLYNDLKETACIKLFGTLGDTIVKIEFTVRPIGIEATLSKIIEWAEDAEEYEMCIRVQKLREFINKNS